MRTSVLACLLLLGAAGATATETRQWVVDTAADLRSGRGDGVGVSEDGRLVPLAGWRRVATLEEPVALAADDGPEGVMVATSHPARLYRVDGRGAERLAELGAEQVTALVTLPQGGVLMATAAPAELVRWRDGTLETVAELGEQTVWDLALFDGAVVAAAGIPATLLRLGDRGVERWRELPDAQARSLAVVDDALLVGTSGSGLVLRVERSGAVSLLVDSPFTEIAALAPAPDGSIWAAAVVGEPQPKKGASKEGQEQADAAAAAKLDLPKVGGETATSELLRLTPEGGLLREHRFTSEVATALAWSPDGLLVGTGYEGHVWLFGAGGGLRAASLDALQVAAVLDHGRAIVAGGPVQVLLREDAFAGGSFRGAAKVLPRPARWGAYRVEPASADVRIRFRAGVSDAPDATWLEWTDWLPAEGSVPVSAGRGLQWELQLAGAAAAIERIAVAYRELNLPPEIRTLAVAEPGMVWLDSPPSERFVDVTHPDLSGIFSILDEQPGPVADRPKKGKQYWRVGYRTVWWEAGDVNDDPLRFSLEVESRDGFRLPVRERIEEPQLAVDTSVLPEGWYRFHLTASDAAANPHDPASATSVSEWFAVDNAPPHIELERQGGVWRVTVRDGISPIQRVEMARDGERWLALTPADGLLDATEERFSFPAASGRHLLTVRAVDAQHNRAVAGAVEEP